MAGIAAAVLLVVAGGALRSCSGRSAGTEDGRRRAPAPKAGLSVAVLLFTNQSGDADAGLFRRRPHRGHHPRARPLQAAHGAGLWRGAAVSRQAAGADGYGPRAERALPGGRQRAPHGRAGAGHGAAHRRRQRHPALGRAIRRPAHRHLRGPGPHRPPGRRHAGDQPAADRPGSRACASRPPISTPTTCCCAPAPRPTRRRAPATAWRASCSSG